MPNVTVIVLQRNLLWMRQDPIHNAGFKYRKRLGCVARRRADPLQLATTFENLRERPFNRRLLLGREPFMRDKVLTQQFEVLSVRFFVPALAAIAIKYRMKNADRDYERFLKRCRMFRVTFGPLLAQRSKAFAVVVTSELSYFLSTKHRLSRSSVIQPLGNFTACSMAGIERDRVGFGNGAESCFPSISL